jgi:hypothetical protein
MPALFAYLIALGLLLGGGYGALTWLAAPEPVKVVAKARPTPRPHFDEASRETASEPSGQQAEPTAQKTSPTVAPPAEASTAPTEQSAQAEAPVPAPVPQNPAVNAPAVNAEVASAQAGPPAEQPQPAQAASIGNQAAGAPAAAAKTVKPKRPHQQRLASRSEKPALALMTLRTIEFPDGHRVTQLVPYRDGDRD